METENSGVSSHKNAAQNLLVEGYIDFSKIEEKTQEQLVLWEDYLIYSVMLGINTKVIDEVFGKIK